MNRTLLSNPLRSRILMFHDVVPDGTPLSDEYACHLSGLLHSVGIHRAKGFTFVSLDTLFSMSRAAAGKGNCVLTFDDGCAGTAAAIPALTELGVPFTLYIATGLLDTPGYISSAQLTALSQNPLCTVGSHLVSHGMCRFMKRETVEQELLDSREYLQRLTGKPVRHLAFPYGSAYACSLRDVRLAKKTGYVTAALTTPTPLSPFSLNARFALPRLNMPETGE